MEILWTPTTTNRKTGSVPTAYVGTSREECRASCSGCPLLPDKDTGGAGCYAHGGTVSMGAASLYKAANKGADRSMSRALRKRRASARMVRVSAIGDAGRIGTEAAREICAAADAEGLAVVGYTHHHREPAVADAWRGRLMASCETEQQADAAVGAGWRATMLVPSWDERRTWRTRAGHRVSACPAQVSEGKVTCNDCLLCDASRTHLAPIIAFRAHGPTVRSAEALLERAEAVAADLAALTAE